MNKIILCGNLCRDVDVIKYANKSCVHNSIAVKRDYKNKEGNYDTDFFNICLWETQADFIGKYANKGDKILISGRLVNTEYEAEDGTKRTGNEVQVENVEIMAKKNTQNTNETSTTNDEPAAEQTSADLDDIFD